MVLVQGSSESSTVDLTNREKEFFLTQLQSSIFAQLNIDTRAYVSVNLSACTRLTRQLCATHNWYFPSGAPPHGTCVCWQLQLGKKVRESIVSIIT